MTIIWFVWSGFGFVVPIVFVLAMVVWQLLIDLILGHGYYVLHGWPKFTAVVFTAILLWFLGRWLNRPSGKILIEKDTGREFQQKPYHSFFMIPVQYWAFLVIAFGLYMAFK
jgi:hypothetical protein